MFLRKPHALMWGEPGNQQWALAMIENTYRASMKNLLRNTDSKIMVWQSTEGMALTSPLWRKFHGITTIRPTINRGLISYRYALYNEIGMVWQGKSFYRISR